MCGRYTLSVPLSNLVDAFDVPPPDFSFSPRYNIAPSQEVPVVADGGRGRRMGLLRWGLVPSWARDPSLGSRLINARAETVSQKPSFRGAFKQRRCLVPFDGFYEWKKEESVGGKGIKTPYWIHFSHGDSMAFAGLWEKWQPEGSDPLFSFTIITTEAVAAIREIHPRMPVILPREAWGPWLDRDASPADLQDMLQPYASQSLVAHPVSPLVNSPRNDVHECVEPVV